MRRKGGEREAEGEDLREEKVTEDSRGRCCCRREEGGGGELEEGGLSMLDPVGVFHFYTFQVAYSLFSHVCFTASWLLHHLCLDFCFFLRLSLSHSLVSIFLPFQAISSLNGQSRFFLDLFKCLCGVSVYIPVLGSVCVCVYMCVQIHVEARE